MKRYDKLLFVDNSNTTLSPMAEAIAQKELLLEDILIDSAGLVVLFPEPVNPKVEAILVSNSLTMKGHTSRAFEQSDFDERTLVIAMTEEIRDKIYSSYEEPLNTVPLLTYTGWMGDIPDPYGGSLQEYGQCFEQLRDIVRLLADKLIQEDK